MLNAEPFTLNAPKPGTKTQKPILTTHYICAEFKKVFPEPPKLKGIFSSEVVLPQLSFPEALSLDCLRTTTISNPGVRSAGILKKKKWKTSLHSTCREWDEPLGLLWAFGCCLELPRHLSLQLAWKLTPSGFRRGFCFVPYLLLPHSAPRHAGLQEPASIWGHLSIGPS